MKKDVLTLQTEQHNPPLNNTVPVSMVTTCSVIPHDSQRQCPQDKANTDS